MSDRGRSPGEELLTVLAQPGCPTCRREADIGRRWLETFGEEHHTDPAVAERVYRAGGFCPAHGREFAAGPAASWAMPRLVLGVITVLGTAVASGAAIPVEPCPACAEASAAALRWTTWLVPALADRSVEDRFREHGGLCVDHVLAIAPLVQPGVAAALVGAARGALGQEGPARDAALAGADADAPRREAVRVERAGDLLAAEDVLPAQPGLDRARAEVEPGGCPLCRSAARATWRYQSWLLLGDRPQPSSPDEQQSCRSHLADVVARAEAPAREVVLAANADRLPPVLEQAAARRGRRGGRDGRDAVLRQRCRTCSVADFAVARTTQLLDAAWRDPQGRAELERSHGICLHHARALPAGSPWRSVLGARLAMATWELEETVRRTSWSTRWEPDRARAGVWPESLARVDGRIDWGLAAVGAGG